MKVKLSLIWVVVFLSVLSFSQELVADVRQKSIEKYSANKLIITNIEGLLYTVQIGVFSKELSEGDFPEVAHPLYLDRRNDGLYVYLVGLFDCRFEALKKHYQLVSNGMFDAFIRVYYNGKVVTMAEADNLLTEKGESVLYNSEINKALNDFLEW